MSAAIEFKVSDGSRAVFSRLRERLGGRVVHEAIGAAMLNAVRTHFDRRATEPNKLGGPKTGFWEKLSAGSHATAAEDEAVVSVPAPILQKLYGGTILPVNSKALAFPVSPNSYGKTAREMRMTGRTKFVPLSRGNVVGIVTTIEAKGVIGEVLFLVVRKVTQAADPEAIPSEETLSKSALDALSGIADQALS